MNKITKSCNAYQKESGGKVKPSRSTAFSAVALDDAFDANNYGEDFYSTVVYGAISYAEYLKHTQGILSEKSDLADDVDDLAASNQMNEGTLKTGALDNANFA